MTILSCTCTPRPGDTTCAAAFQDARYGKGKRVMNPTAKDEVRCTVCGTAQRYAGNPVKKKKSGGSGGAKSYIAIPPAGGWLGGAPDKNGYRKI